MNDSVPHILLLQLWISSCECDCFPAVQADDGFQVEMVMRLQCKNLSWAWIYIQASKSPESHELSCTNFIIRYEKTHCFKKQFSLLELFFFMNSNVKLTHCFALSVKQRLHIYGQKSAAMPSGRRFWPIPAFLQLSKRLIC